LMPLSIAAVLGGTITLIGTSTNLVASGAQQARYAKTDPANAQFRILTLPLMASPMLSGAFCL
jgi:Na+/H+ antiporter NhaD/arsenite permease-like protein